MVADSVPVTRCGAHVFATTHNLGAVVDASSFAEAIATGRAGEVIEECRAIEVALGVPPEKPTLVMTDNKANALVGSGAGTLRSRHALRRYLASFVVLAASFIASAASHSTTQFSNR